MLDQLIEFQLTRPVRVATGRGVVEVQRLMVSTHATRAGRDQVEIAADGQIIRFQLTRPVRVATRTQSERISKVFVSTHATRAGRDED